MKTNSSLSRLVMMLPLLLGAGLTLVQPCAGAPFQFEQTGSLHDARYWHTATLLPNGKVLVAGGYDHSGTLASAELYDPASGTWTTTGSLTTARDSHTATLLPNGKVLVAGGQDSTLSDRERGTLRSGERDLDGHRQPRHRTRISHGDVAAQRQGARRRRCWQQRLLASAELYDPASGTWTATGSLATARSVTRRRCCPTARCSSQAVMTAVASLASAELYDPATGTWTATGSLATARVVTRRRCCPTARCSSQAV